jgi:phosphohistidine phosphatase SixA
MRFFPFLAVAAAAVCTLWAPGVLAQQARPPVARELSPAELVAELRRGNDIMYFRHTATDSTQSDANMKSYEDCARQRNLIDRGRRDAQLIGASIRALSIPVGKVLASPHCRTVETAELAFGRFEKTDEARYRMGAAGNEERYAELRRLLATRPAPGTNTVIVGHGSPIQKIAGLDLGEGDIEVIRPIDNRFELLGRIRVQDWAALSSAAGK